MTTKALVKTPVRRAAGVIQPLKQNPRSPGRPVRDWLKLKVAVPHPLAERWDKTIDQATVMSWTGKSRQTVAKWAKAGGIPDLACRRLCQLYAHGLPTLPPEANDKSAKAWQQFRFRQLETPTGQQWHLITPTGESFNAAQVWAARQCAGRYFQALDDVTRWKKAAEAAQREAQRLTDNFGAQC